MTKLNTSESEPEEVRDEDRNLNEPETEDTVSTGEAPLTRDFARNGYGKNLRLPWICLLYTSPSPRDLSTSRMPSSA